MLDKAPNAYDFHTLEAACEGAHAEIDGKWVPVRPLGQHSFLNRISLAWQVFTGRADVLRWPGGQ